MTKARVKGFAIQKLKKKRINCEHMREYLNLVTQLLEQADDIDSFKHMFSEEEHNLKMNIVRFIMDQSKFENIANDVFIKDIYPLLKNNQYHGKRFDYPVKDILKKFPETRGILKKVVVELSDDNTYDLGVIFAETEEIDRFKIVLFMKALFDLVDCANGKFNNLQLKDKEQFETYVLGTLVHELTHLIDYFRYTRDELIADFNKTYPRQETEKRAIANEFLTHFVAEDGVSIVKRTNDVDIFQEFVKHKMKCWQLLERLDFPFNDSFINELLTQVYNYFKFGRDEFGKLKTERAYDIYPFVHYVKREDVIHFKPSEETLNVLRNLNKQD